MRKYDIAIIGAGPGGYVAALYAAGCGKKVALIERDLTGGTCLNRGCIPTKALLSLLKDKVDYASMAQVKDDIVNRLRNGVEGLLKSRAVDMKRGPGRLLDKGVVEAGGERVEAKSVIIATGSRPVEIASFKPDGQKITTSADMLLLKEIPQSLLIIGGGYIGCEFGYFYSSLGVKVTIAEMMDRLLPGMDRELSKNMELILKKNKVKILIKTKADESMKPSFDKILVAIGRRANIEDAGLEKVGVNTKNDHIAVNQFMRTSLEDTYAIGDAVGPPMLAHAASHEGICAVDNVLGKASPVDYSAVPACIYTDPEIATVGLTKEEAISKGIKVKIAKFPFTASGKAQAMRKTQGFVKMVGEEESGTILGVHTVGPEATNLIAEATLMVKFKMKASDIAGTMHAHPTLPESLMEAAFALLGKPIHAL